MNTLTIIAATGDNEPPGLALAALGVLGDWLAGEPEVAEYRDAQGVANWDLYVVGDKSEVPIPTPFLTLPVPEKMRRAFERRRVELGL